MRRREAVRYTDNGIRLKHSVGEREEERGRPLLFVPPLPLQPHLPKKHTVLKRKKKSKPLGYRSRC